MWVGFQAFFPSTGSRICWCTSGPRIWQRSVGRAYLEKTTYQIGIPHRLILQILSIPHRLILQILSGLGVSQMWTQECMNTSVVWCWSGSRFGRKTFQSQFQLINFFFFDGISLVPVALSLFNSMELVIGFGDCFLTFSSPSQLY